jgi:molecular chaperone GrpE
MQRGNDDAADQKNAQDAGDGFSDAVDTSAADSDIDAGEETHLEMEEGEQGDATCAQKLAALRGKLKAAHKERDEYLAGWQRAKADVVNVRRMAADDTAMASVRAKAALLGSLLPAFDSFEQAKSDDAWHALPEEWRKGMERVFSQLEKGFAEQSVERFAKAGEPFDPQHHECMSMAPATEAAQDHTIAQVLQQGYRIGETVVRPAKVTVYEYTTNN